MAKSPTKAGAGKGPAKATAEPGQVPRPSKFAQQTTAKAGDPNELVKVEAVKVCYYGDKRRRVGDIFWCRRSMISPTGMRIVHATAPERITGAQASLTKIHDEIVSGAVGGGNTDGGGAATVDDDPIGSGSVTT